ncbi:MAG: hypothetical protein NT098_00395 [Candidatus Parcubacteria bacterium]|nr:hypothetical protein [Candidatus Parcubacteria bacterium]
MKRFATLLLLIGFAGMAVFGLFVMDFAMGHDNVDCIASQVNGNSAVCPSSLLQMAFHHISVFQAFSLAVIAYTAALAFLFLLVFLVFTSLWIRFFSLRPPRFLRSLQRRQTEPPPFQRQKITRWLALFEHSPSLV